MIKNLWSSLFFKALLMLWLVCVPQLSVANDLHPLMPASDNAGQYDLAPCLDYVEDTQNAYSIEEVASPAMASRYQSAIGKSGQVNFGYSSSAFWFRCNLQQLNGNMLLEIAYPALDDIQVYMPNATGQYQMQQSGDKQAFNTRPYLHRNFVFPLQLTHTNSTLYFRVQSNGSLTIPVTLWKPDAFHQHNQVFYPLLAMYYGIFLALALYNLFLFYSIRERVYLEYVLFVISMAIGQASLNGFGNEFLWPNFPAWGNVALPIGFSMTGMFFTLFIRSFLNLSQASKRLNRVNWAFCAWFIMSALAVLTYYKIGAMMVSIGGLFYSFLALFIGLACLARRVYGAKYFIFALTLVLLGVGLMGARNFGWVPTNFFTMYAMQIGSSIEMLLLSFALADRINQMRSLKEQAQAESLQIKQTMLEGLRESELMLETRVKLRTVELEAANQLLLQNEQTLAKLVRQDALTGLGNRIALQADFELAIARAKRSSKGVVILLLDLDRFKPVNDTFGHAVGDAVLKEVAFRLQMSVRKTDAVMRIGGDEFVIILEEIHSFEDVQPVIDKIIEAVKQPVMILKVVATIGCSIGVASYPEDGETLHDLMLKADMRMYSAKTSGGNQFINSES